MKAEVYIRMATRRVAKTIDRIGKTLLVILSFGGSSSWAVIPGGGIPAGALSRDVISSLDILT
jgi:hypothetical protein